MIELIETRIAEMEHLLEDGYDYDEEEKLQDLYYQLKQMLQEAWAHTSTEKALKTLEQLEKRFRLVCREWETPEERDRTTLNMMFPDKESMEGFDVDDFWGLD